MTTLVQGSDLLGQSASAVWPVVPEVCVAVSACLILLIDVYGGHKRRGLSATLTMIALLVGVLLTSRFGMVLQRELLFNGMYVADGLGTFLKLVAFVTMATAVFYSQNYLEQRHMLGGEYYVLCLTGLLGVFVLISAHSLLTVYLGVELLSLSLYALVAFDRDSGVAAEAAIKYFVLGAIGSGVLLYGMSMLYGMTGTLDLDRLSQIVSQTASRRFSRRESGSRMGETAGTQLPSNSRKPSGVNWGSAPELA